MPIDKVIRPPQIPGAPRSIEKGSSLTTLVNENAIECLGLNVLYVHRDFDVDGFYQTAVEGLEPLTLMQRGKHVAFALQKHLPSNYSEAVSVLVDTLQPEAPYSEEFGLAGFFHLPHSFFIAEFGRDPTFNDGEDPFDVSMKAMYELTKRFTSEFAIRDFIIDNQERTLAQLETWLTDESPHVRRLCSEGSRPKLPWGKGLKAIVTNPQPTLPLLEALKNDVTLYVRRSVANHLGDIAKDHPELVFELCENWLDDATAELKWVIRHALRHPAKKKDERALSIREAAKG